MVFSLGMIMAGLALLVLAGDALVKGAVNLSLKLGIPAIIVGLTVVAFGTSAPELLVSINAILDGVPALALGNVVGSNTANILLVLGVPALIATVPVSRDLTRDFGVMIGATGLFVGLAFTGVFGWWQGLLLLAALIWMLFDSYCRAQAHRKQLPAGADDDDLADLEGVEDGISGAKIAFFLIAGIIGLPVGAHLLVEGAVDVASRMGVSEAVIGLSLVAIGTSLPELATTVAAAFRREAGVALGNVIGSNIFNLLGIIGVAALVGNIPVPASMLQSDLWVMVGASVVLGLFIWTGRGITRFAGIGLLALYGLYLVYLFA